MRLYELFSQVDVQSEYKIVKYDYDIEKRVEVDEDENTDKEIDYIYVEDGIIYIEIDEGD